MKALSRHMPKEAKYKIPLLGKAILLLVGIGFAWFCIKNPFIILIIAVILFISWISTLIQRKRLSKIFDQRLDESICTFARSFDCHKIDTWIIRAVYEELQKYLAKDDFPIRASDRLDEDLRIDREDLDDIAYVIAQRAGYSFDDNESNPYYDNVNTVEDLVMFFLCQIKARSNQILDPIVTTPVD